MTFTIPLWVLWMLAGYAVGRGLELLVKFQIYLDNQVSEPRETIHPPAPPEPANPIPMPRP